MDPTTEQGRAHDRDGPKSPVPPLQSDALADFGAVSPSSATTGENARQAATKAAAAASLPPQQQPTHAGVTFAGSANHDTTADGAGAVAKRPSRSGRQAIHEASTRSSASAAAAGTGAGMVTALSVNAHMRTIPEEHAEFRARNRVKPSYRGPVYTVEDVSVPCHCCGGPVDPVSRVPVGSLFFHAHCLRCFLCGRKEGVAGLYVQVDRQAVCSECAGRGYDRWVPRQEVQSRGMIFGAIHGDVYAAVDAHDRGERGLPRLSASPPPTATLNRSTVPGALPPSLSIRPVHTARNTSRRSFALMERQQYYTQSDNNLLMRPPDAAGAGESGMRRVSKAGKARSAVAHGDQPQMITASRPNA